MARAQQPASPVMAFLGMVGRSMSALPSERWFSFCVTGEDKVARFDLIVAGKAGFHECLVARFAVLEVSETPTARCGILFCVLDLLTCATGHAIGQNPDMRIARCLTAGRPIR